MIYVIYGPGGAGKSRYQMEIIVEQLRSTKRNIVTNLALNIPALAEYMQRAYPAEAHDVYRRIRILTRDEAAQFWLYRGRLRYVGPDASDYEIDRGEYGVCYIIDEAGACGFNAIGWATNIGRSSRGEEATWYLDQQRKFSDDVFVSTNGRAPHGIAKPFRDKAHYFIKLRNEYLATYGVFRGRGRFVAKWYQTEPDKTTEPIKVVTFGVDAEGLASCYYTEHGMGVSGVSADKGAKAKGISIWWAAVAAALVVGAVAVVPWFMGKATASYLAPGGTPGAVLAEQSASGGLRGGSPLPRERGKGREGFSEHQGRTLAPVFVQGYVVARGKVTVTLTSGETLTEEDLTEVNARGVRLKDGRFFHMRRPTPSPPPPVAVVSVP